MVVPVAVLVLITVGAGRGAGRARRLPPAALGRRLPPVISALGVAFILQSLARNVYGASWRTYPPGIALTGGITLAEGVRIGAMQIASWSGSRYCSWPGCTSSSSARASGTAMRAGAIDPVVARLMGIDVDRIIAIVFLIGPGLGGIAGLIVALYYGSFDFTLGWTFGLKAFIAAILGGIGNIPGAMLGGMLLGVAETLAAGYISPQWKDAIAYIVLILILLLRPTGLLGERVAARV